MEKDIGRINKNDTTDIVLRVDDFAGKSGLTIREFITTDRYTGFTKAGVKIQAEDFEKFKEMVNSVTEEDLTPAEEEKDEAKEELPPEQETLEKAAAEKEKVSEEEERVPTGPEETVEPEKAKEELPDY